jgi:hypothetical protein
MTRRSRSIMARRAEVAVAVLRGAKPEIAKESEMSLAGRAPRRTATGQGWRWWQDYGGGRHLQPSVLQELSRSGESGA